MSSDGSAVLFATDGRPGAGLHGLFVSRLVDGEWGEPLPLPVVNGPDEGFDAAYLDDGRSLVFTRRTKDQDGADLWLAAWHDGRYAPPRRLGPEINVDKGWNLSPSTTAAQPGVLNFSSHRPDDSAGRLDIYRIRYRLASGPADATGLPDREPRPADSAPSTTEMMAAASAQVTMSSAAAAPPQSSPPGGDCPSPAPRQRWLLSGVGRGRTAWPILPSS